MDGNKNTEQIFKVEIQADAAIKTLADYNTAVEETSAEMRELTRRNMEGSEEFAKLSQVLATQKRERRELQKVIQNDIKLQREEQTSLKGMRAQLSNLTKQYDELSAAERNGAKGQEMRDHINQITTELKKAEEETQRYYRNVGNYEQSLKAALRDTTAELRELNYRYDNLTAAEKESAAGRAMEEKLKSLTEKAGKMRDAMDAASRQIRNAASDTRTFDTLNEAAQLTAASYGLMQTAVVAFGASEKSAEEITKRMAVVLQTLNSLQTIQNLLQKESNIMMGVRNLQTWAAVQAESAAAAATSAHGVALGVATIKQAAFNAVAKVNPYVLIVSGIIAAVAALSAFSGASDEATDKLKDANTAADEFGKSVGETAGKDIAAARVMFNAAVTAAAGTDKRKKAIQDLQKAYPNYFGDLDAERASIADLTKRYKNLTEAITANAIAHGAQTQIEKESAKLAELNAKLSMLTKERAKLSQYAGAGGGILGGLFDPTGAKMYDNLTKQINDTSDALNRQNEALGVAVDYYIQAKSEAEKFAKIKPDKDKDKDKGTGRTTSRGTTKTTEEKAAEKAAADAAKHLETLRNELLTSYDKLKETTAKDSADSVAGIEKYYALQLNTLRTHFAELGELTTEEQTAYDALYNSIIEKRDAAIAQFLADADKKEQEIKAKLAQQDETTLSLQIENAAENSPERMALELQLLQMQYEQKLQMHQGNEEMLTAITAENERKRNEIEKRYADAAHELLLQRAAAIGGALGNASKLLEQFAGKSKAAAVASKALALGEIAVNQGVAIAAGIKQAQSVPFPANIAAIATTIGAILAGVTQALSAVKSAKFATGGYVSGAGTSTSDSIPARLSNGESVINANSTALFTGLLSALNQIGGGIPIQAGESGANIAGEAMLARAFAAGAAALPAPVVSVVEIARVNDRVVNINERATL